MRRVGGNTLPALHALLARLHREVAFDTKATDVPTSAGEAFARKRGVCQDLNHIFIAAARSLGIPARYIGGHFRRNDGVTEQNAGHAWAEAFVPDLGWVAFDTTNGICATDAHVRVAVGLDYLGAAPVRGSRMGGGSEALDVSIRVVQDQDQAAELDRRCYYCTACMLGAHDADGGAFGSTWTATCAAARTLVGGELRPRVVRVGPG